MKQSILSALLAVMFILQGVSAQEAPSQGQRLELFLLPIIVFGSVAISLVVYKSKSKPKPQIKK